MKKLIVVSVALLVCGINAVFAQKSQPSDYNLRKAFELLEKNEEKDALKYVNKQIEDYPKSADAYVVRAQIYRQNELYGDALNDLNRALKLWNKDALFNKYSVYWWRAVVHNDMENYDAALLDYDAAYKLVAKGDDIESISDILFQKASTYESKKDYEKAASAYSLMLKHNESNQMAMAGLARLLIIKEKYKEAIEISNKSEKCNKSYEGIYKFRMQAYEKLGENDKAIDDAIRYFETSDDPEYRLVERVFNTHPNYALIKVNVKLNQDPNSTKWKMLRISIYELMSNYVEAIKEYNQLEKDHGASSTIYYYRSICYNELGYHEHAINDVTKCIESVGLKSAATALEQRAGYYEKLGRFNDAINDYSTIIKLDPMLSLEYVSRGWCYYKMKNYDAALNDFSTTIDINKTAPSIVRVLRGKVYLRKNLTKEAKSDFEEVLKQDTVADSGSSRHFALHYLGRDAEAEAWINQVLSKNKDNEGIYYDKSCLLSIMGKLDEAIATLRIAFEKGYKDFAHIASDDDMDPIRNHPDFISLINEYKGKTRVVLENCKIENVNDEIAKISEIPIKKMHGGTYEVACSVNNLPLKFIFDTGASSVSISSVEASFMLKNGYLKEEDIKGKEYFSTATGEIHEGTIICLKEIKIGNAILRNVNASVAHNQQAPLLLGQSVLERFGTITIDNINSKLIIKQ